MQWNIISDSSCDLLELENQYDNIRFSSVPFVISVDKDDYIDDSEMDTAKMVDHMEACKTASRTSCPNPGAWLQEFETPGHVIALTISSNLSGSYNSAFSAREMILAEEPDRKIEILDSHSTGPEMILIIRKLCELIQNGLDFEQVIAEINHFMRHTHIIFALSSFNNLIKNGRMSKIKGLLASKLGLIGIGIGSEIGTIHIKGIVRGKKKAISAIIQDMVDRGFQYKNVVINHCQGQEMAEELKKAILERWENVKVTIIPTRGLTSYYAERGGLIVGY